jgi:ribulose-phosphate 3-epimerase
MTTSIVLAPSLLAADFTRLGEQITEAENAGADWIHVDVMDGHFVPNLTMGPFIVEACRRATQLPLDVHLMVEKPENLLEAFAQAGATGLNVHVEACPHLHRTLQQIRSLGCRVGVTLNPGTPAASIKPVLHMLDLVLVMSVNPGFGGQTFLHETIAKVAEVRGMLDTIQSAAWLEVDGGISAETLPLMLHAGATAFVAGVAVFHHPQGVAGGIRALRDAVKA